MHTLTCIHVYTYIHALTTPPKTNQVLPLAPGEIGQGKQCPRFDFMCGSEDSIGSLTSEPRAPEAGRWFDYQVRTEGGRGICEYVYFIEVTCKCM